MRIAEQRALQRALVDALLKSLRPALEGVVTNFRSELAQLLGDFVERQLVRERKARAAQPRRRQRRVSDRAKDAA
jgi:hypothetical protein